MKPFDQLRTVAPQDVKSVTMTHTVSLDKLKPTVQRFQELFPAASLHVVTQWGRADSLRAELPDVDVVEALPNGTFGLGKLLQVDYKAVKLLNSDVLALMYNNRFADKYFALKALSTMLGARKVVGFYYDEWDEEKSWFAPITISRIMAMVILRLFLLPLEFALILVAVLIFTCSGVIRRLRKAATGERAAPPRTTTNR